MKKLIFLFVLFAVSITEVLAVQSLRIGIENSVLLGREQLLIEETLNALKAGMKRTIVVHSYTETDLRKALDNNEIDLFISSGSFFSSMGNRGVRDLATAISDRAYDPNHGKSATVLIRAKNNRISRLEELKKAKVFFNPEYGEEVLFFLFGEVVSNGEKHSKVFSEFSNNLIRQKLTLDKQVEGLLNYQWDAVILPACQLETESERIAINSLDVDILSPKIHSNLRCLHSTSLYPNITIATLPSLPASISRQLSTILLSLPATKQGMFWGTASDFSGIDKVLRLIDRDAHASERRWSFSRVLSEYWFIFLGILSLVSGLLAHSIRSEYLVQKRTSQLTSSLKKQEELKRQAVLTEEKLGKLQRLGTINQMSSLFAHELRQPLNAIRCYTFSLSRLAKKEEIEPQKFREGLDEISMQVVRADEIIQKVRDYVKNKRTSPKAFSLIELLNHTIKIFEISHENCYFDISKVEDVNVYGDPLEVELIFSNLIKNAYEAVREKIPPKIYIAAESHRDSYVEVNVWDNGPELSDIQLQTFENGLKSTKPDGLGLGLSIVRTFIEKSGGGLTFSKSQLGGLLVKFTLPVVEKGLNNE